MGITQGPTFQEVTFSRWTAWTTPTNIQDGDKNPRSEGGRRKMPCRGNFILFEIYKLLLWAGDLGQWRIVNSKWEYSAFCSTVPLLYYKRASSVCIKSRRVGLNHRPADYESAALPLSYAGIYLRSNRKIFVPDGIMRMRTRQAFKM
jgi:hypothetical protein